MQRCFTKDGDSDLDILTMLVQPPIDNVDQLVNYQLMHSMRHASILRMSGLSTGLTARAAERDCPLSRIRDAFTVELAN